RWINVTEDEAGQRIDNYLAARLKGVPKSRIYRILRSGEVRINSKRVEAKQRVAAGDRIRIPPVRVAERGEREPAPHFRLPVLFRNERQRVRLALAQRRSAEGKRVSVSDEGQEAETVFRRLARGERFSLLEAELLTGRTHQIRVHLAHLGHPVLGDGKYGDFTLNHELRKLGLKRMFLHAARIGFAHPISGADIDIASP